MVHLKTLFDGTDSHTVFQAHSGTIVIFVMFIPNVAFFQSHSGSVVMFALTQTVQFRLEKVGSPTFQSHSGTVVRLSLAQVVILSIFNPIVVRL